MGDLWGHKDSEQNFCEGMNQHKCSSQGSFLVDNKIGNAYGELNNL